LNTKVKGAAEYSGGCAQQSIRNSN
jgi:hypothetical protein